jgi:predicted  nucleic acid-binding Zn-ribbon protein
MNDTKAQWESTGLERFGHLEDKIFRLVEEFKAIRKDNDSLRAENKKLNDEIEELHRRKSAEQDSLAQFQKERNELRERVEKALNLLDTIEAR